MPTQNIAVLITCFNRKKKTLSCLDALFQQVLLPDTVFTVYLVDDGSTDGTSEAVEKDFPQVKILQGNGQLFWNGGMRLAFAESIKYNYDYYFWLNDDTILYPDAVAILLKTASELSEKGFKKTVLVGSTCDLDDGKLTYGGVVRKTWFHPFHFERLVPGDMPKQCDTMNGNCVLIDHRVVKMVGNLDPVFTHGRGDFDYGLRAKKVGCSIWIVPKYVGLCNRNPPQTTVWNDPNVSFLQRFKYVNQPKGLPFKEQKVFAYRHAGLAWPIFWLLPYLRLVLISLKQSLK